MNMAYTKSNQGKTKARPMSAAIITIKAITPTALHAVAFLQ